jgi:biopolymer transport protein ExbB
MRRAIPTFKDQDNFIVKANNTMSNKTHPYLSLALVLLLIPTVALAWWNDDWKSRKSLSVDLAATGADIQETLSDFPLLVRLHTGNFGFFTELAENGKDIRFMLDDKTPLKHQVEKVDALSELGLVWVKLPTLRGGVATDGFTLYYGNANAADGSDSKGLYDVNQALVFHFAEGEILPQDATAYGLQAKASKAVIDPAGWIGAAARFDGQGGIDVDANPALAITPDSGWSFSSWVKIDQPQSNAVIVQAADGNAAIELAINNSEVVASYRNGSEIRTPAATVATSKWTHLGLVAAKDSLTLYVDGQAVGSVAIALQAATPAVKIGSGFIGALDEVQIAKQARSADWLKLQFRSQSPDFSVLNFGADESAGGGGDMNYFVIILQSLTVDGWVVIALCGVMFVISSLVTIGKASNLRQARKDNAAFLEQYRNIDANSIEQLDQEESDDEREIGDSEFLAMMVGKHDHFQASPIYHVYHAGVRELKKRFSNGDGEAKTVLTAEAIEVVRTRLDAAVVREAQKLNKNMVLLTIAISGGPFLGLLGTVLGVMITFAVIAATGDVNINSIAPGISGALLATVAGLAVAIPALFAYNYLLTQIKDVTADMQVFTDEFLAVITERIANRQRASKEASAEMQVFSEQFMALFSQQIASWQRGAAS